MSKSSLTLELNLEDICCSLCSNYLSCPPIYNLPDGKDVCESCSLTKNDFKSHRQLTLEKLLHNVLFPCVNKKYGCPDTYKFGMASDHINCKFVPIQCTFFKMFECKWKGAMKDFPQHAISEHPSIVYSKAEFEVDLKCDKEESCVVSNKENFFLVDYKYDSSTSIFKYVIAFYTEFMSQFSTVKLKNISDPGLHMQVHRHKCVTYFDGLLEVQCTSDINLCQFAKLLDNATSLLICLLVDVPEVKNVDAITKYKVFDVLKCNYCGMLTYPLFETNGMLCRSCKHNLQSVFDPSQLKLQNYQCRWHGCKQIIKGDKLDVHDISCEYRQYTCLRCSYYSTVQPTIQHMIAHKLLYFETQIEQEIVVSDKSSSLSLFSFVANEFVMITIGKEVDQRGGIITVSYKTTSTNTNKIKFSFKLKHSHCKLEMNYSISSNSFTINCWNLHGCFKNNDKYTAMVILN